MAHVHKNQNLAVDIQTWRGGDRKSIRRLLCFLPSLYPDADEWLDRRLDDIEGGHGRCLTIWANRALRGIMIETEKGPAARKISTFYLHASIRRSGIATRLLETRVEEWHSTGIRMVYITMPTNSLHLFDTLLTSHGFARGQASPDRYGEGRDEITYSAVL